MPFSDNMPAMVFPDTIDGREDSYKSISEQPLLQGKVAYCYDFKKTGYTLDSLGRYGCANATSEGERSHNWCYRCVCGFIIANLTERDLSQKRNFTSLTGY